MHCKTLTTTKTHIYNVDIFFYSIIYSLSNISSSLSITICIEDSNWYYSNITINSSYTNIIVTYCSYYTTNMGAMAIVSRFINWFRIVIDKIFAFSKFNISRKIFMIWNNSTVNYSYFYS